MGPNPLVDAGPGWFQVFSALVMIAALGFTAIFTPGVVNRMMAPRLVALAGPRSLPRRDHVVVVGLGQVGLRLCLLLRGLGVRCWRSNATRRVTTSPAPSSTGSPS